MSDPMYPQGKPVVHVNWAPDSRNDHADLREWLADDDAEHTWASLIKGSVRKLLAEHDSRGGPRFYAPTWDAANPPEEPPLGTILACQLLVITRLREGWFPAFPGRPGEPLRGAWPYNVLDGTTWVVVRWGAGPA